MLPPFLQAVREQGHRVFDSGPYNINLIGIRRIGSHAGLFDDFITCWYLDSAGAWTSHWWPATTDPGLYWLQNPGNVKGTAVMVEGQYPKLWKIGLHKGYKAFQQIGPVRVFRDRNQDDVLDLDPVSEDSGLFGINGHASDSNPWDTSDKSREGKEVGEWSAGCQVWANSAHFRHAIQLAEQSAALYGNSFTYTLVSDYRFE
jgi:hypothetical protein